MTAQIATDIGGGPIAGQLTLSAAQVNTPVVLSNVNNAGVLGWRWELLSTPEISLTLFPPPADTFGSTRSVTPDVKGHTILVRLTTYLDATRTILDDADQITVKVRFDPPFDWVIPAVGETIEDDSDQGWSEEVNEILRDVNEHLHDFSITEVQPGEFLHIRARRQMLVHGIFTNNGVVQVDGLLSLV